MNSGREKIGLKKNIFICDIESACGGRGKSKREERRKRYYDLDLRF
jgi:hypothetical protein